MGEKLYSATRNPSPVPRKGDEVVYVTHRLNDPTTWYQEAARVTGASTTTSDNLTYDVGEVNLICLTRGRLRTEKSLRASLTASLGHAHEVVAYVDGVAAVQDEPLGGAQHDYYVNYEAGEIVFHASQAGKTVTADFSYAVGSTFTIAPPAGKVLAIERAESQFSTDIVYNDTVLYEVYGFVDVFAPQLIGNGYSSGDKIQLSQFDYPTLASVIDEAQGAYPVIPAMGGSVRGIQHAIYGFPFNWRTTRDVYASAGMELRVRLENDNPFGGEYTTTTFQCTLTDET